MKFVKYVEEGGRRVAVASDPGKLPKVGRGWKEFGPIEIEATDGPRIGADSAEIIAAVESDGYFMLPEGEKQ
jgi:hypothetical protein